MTLMDVLYLFCGGLVEGAPLGAISGSTQLSGLLVHCKGVRRVQYYLASVVLGTTRVTLVVFKRLWGYTDDVKDALWCQD